MKFKVGDRVVGIKEDDNLDIRGKTGTIKHIGRWISVEFDENFAGNLWDCDCECRHGWRCKEHSLEHLDQDPFPIWETDLAPEQRTKFIVGDKVLITSEDWNPIKGKTGTIRIAREGSTGPTQYGVEVDDVNSGHSCDGVVEGNHGWWVYEEDLEPLETDPFPLWSEKDE